MSDKRSGLIGEIFEQGGAIASTAASQLGTPVGASPQVQAAQPDGGEESPDSAVQKKAQQILTSQKPKQTTQSVGQHVLSQLGQKGPTPQEEKKIEELRRELHGKYYQTFTAPKQQEERPLEKIEREKQQEIHEMQIKQQEEKKKEPISIVRAKNKAEKFRGVSG